MAAAEAQLRSLGIDLKTVSIEEWDESERSRDHGEQAQDRAD
jgi:hypothetical protein